MLSHDYQYINDRIHDVDSFLADAEEQTHEDKETSSKEDITLDAWILELFDVVDSTK